MPRKKRRFYEDARAGDEVGGAPADGLSEALWRMREMAFERPGDVRLLMRMAQATARERALTGAQGKAETLAANMEAALKLLGDQILPEDGAPG